MLSFKDLKRSAAGEPSGLPALRIALLGDTATQFLATAIKGTGMRRGFHVDLFEADFNQVERQLLDPSSDLYRFAPEYVIVFQSTHKLAVKHALMPESGRASLADECLGFVASVCNGPLMAGRKVIWFNFPEIEDTVYGSYANSVESSLTYQVRRLNCGLMDLSRSLPDLFICDIAGLQNKFGRDFMFSPNIYVSTEMVLSLDSLPYVASRVMDIVCAARGMIRKCVILDLDGTLWGGVIGDDGIEGIQIGHNLGIGKAFSEFQLWLKKLKERGIILCVVSKNDEKVAREAFEKHPDMVLRMEDIAVFIANWETKVDNIRTVREILNIGFDSMVFLDDNPFERNMVRENIPGITVPELPEDPGEYLEFLYSLNLFETVSVSREDAGRTEQYRTEAARVSFSKTFTDEDDYLKSLGMVSEVSGFTKFNTARVAQLSQRSNQFNLRTVRYSEGDVAAIAADPDAYGLAFTLSDRFGDNGLVAVAVLRRMDGETLFIENWFMSCRVLKRGMETFTLDQIVSVAKDAGYSRIVGEYVRSSRNAMVEDHYPSLGFVCMDDGCGARYALDVAAYQPRSRNIKRK